MTVKINEKGSEAFYKETINAASQYAYILKNHQYKVKDYFRQFRNLLILCAVMGALLIAMTAAWGISTMLIIGFVLFAVSAVLCGAFMFKLKATLKNMMTNWHHSILRLDESGVELAVQNTQTMKIMRKNIAVVRVFSESVCFVPAAGSGVIIAVEKRFAEEVPDWIRENWPEAEIA